MVKMSYYAEYTDVVADKHKVPGYRGSFAENFGRFIPCRGGGTATTYYSDDHNVDEESLTFSFQGGKWCDDIAVGIMYRFVCDTPTAAAYHVASRLIYLS